MPQHPHPLEWSPLWSTGAAINCERVSFVSKHCFSYWLYISHEGINVVNPKLSGSEILSESTFFFSISLPSSSDQLSRKGSEKPVALMSSVRLIFFYQKRKSIFLSAPLIRSIIISNRGCRKCRPVNTNFYLTYAHLSPFWVKCITYACVRDEEQGCCSMDAEADDADDDAENKNKWGEQKLQH